MEIYKMREAYHKNYLKTEEVVAIKEALKRMPIPKVAKMFNQKQANIRNIYLGVTYRNVGDV